MICPRIDAKKGEAILLASPFRYAAETILARFPPIHEYLSDPWACHGGRRCPIGVELSLPCLKEKRRSILYHCRRFLDPDRTARCKVHTATNPDAKASARVYPEMPRPKQPLTVTVGAFCREK